MYCQVCEAYIPEGGAETIEEHLDHHRYPGKHGKAIADMCNENPYISLEEIGGRIGVSSERVRQILAQHKRRYRDRNKYILVRPINHIGGANNVK